VAEEEQPEAPEKEAGMIDILNPAPKVIEALMNIDLPSGASIDVKMM
jgi:ribosomal protein S10